MCTYLVALALSDVIFLPTKGPSRQYFILRQPGEEEEEEGGRRREETSTALDGKTAGKRQEGWLDASAENARPIRGGME